MNPRIRQSVRALKPYVPGQQISGPGVVKLNTNENPYPPAPGVLAALAEDAGALLSRYPDPVCTALREALAAYHHCEPEQILVGNGSDEILALCIRAFVERDGSVGYFDPSYSLYPVLAAIEDVATRPVPLTAHFGWNMPAGYEASLFFMTNPNAPTSLLFPRQEVEAFCAGFKGVVVLDEAYVDFARESCLDLALRSEKVLVARTFSKSFSLAGLRLGYVVGHRELVDALYKIKDSYNVDALAQRLGQAAVREVEVMRRNTARVRATRARLTEALEARDFEVAPSETNFLWVRPPEPAARTWFEALAAEGVYVRHFSAERTAPYLRITVGTDNEIDRLIEVIDQVAAVQKR